MTYEELRQVIINNTTFGQQRIILDAVREYYEASNGAKPIVRRRLPSVEDIKRWNQLLVGFGEEKMMNDVQATFA